MATRASTGVGASLECSQQQHHLCQQAGCRCGCHLPAKDIIQRTERPEMPVPDRDVTVEAVMVCPKCHKSGRPTDKFCRHDGTKLMVGGRCPTCLAETLPEDVFCGLCGGTLSG